MAENSSNANGRALEYIITRKIISRMDAVQQGDTSANQLRDKEKLIGLSAELKSRFELASDVLCQWINEQIYDSDGEVHVNRLSDNDAKNGDVTDVSIARGGKTLNLSIKHNHYALKHQRPPTTAQRIGYAKNSEEDRVFRGELDGILETFLIKAKKLKPDAKKFNELKDLDPNFINHEMYLPICALVTNTINNLCKKSSNVQALFSFIVGTNDYHKVIVTNKNITLMKFADIDMPDTLIATQEKSNYVILTFSNGWVIRLRLHTAASKLGKSLKFDSVANVEDFMPVENLKF